MGLLDYFKRKSYQKKIFTFSELDYSPIRNVYQFVVEITDNNCEVLFVHFFNGIRTNEYGETADLINGFSHYGIMIGAGKIPIYTLTLVHIASGKRIILDRTLIQNSGLPTLKFKTILNDLYLKFGEIRKPTPPICYDRKNKEWLLMESSIERNERTMRAFEGLRVNSNNIKVPKKRYFLDEFYLWFIEDTDYVNELEKKWFGIENGVLVDYYNSKGEIKRGEISDAYGMRDFDLVSIENEIGEIPLQNIIKIIE